MLLLNLNMKYFIDCLKKYAVFEGRSHRKEYWMFTLFVVIFSILLSIVDGITGIAFISSLFSLGVLIPSLAVTVRRLHDINKSGWWILIGLIPFVGFIILFIWAIKKSDVGDNRFGAPLGY